MKIVIVEIWYKGEKGRFHIFYTQTNTHEVKVKVEQYSLKVKVSHLLKRLTHTGRESESGAVFFESGK